MSWRETEYEDLHRIALPYDSSEADVRSMMPDNEESRILLRRDARTWEEDGEILAIVGVGYMWKGVGTAWTLLTTKATERGVALTRGVLRCIRMLHVERGYWRLQATVERENPVARHWLLRLGFEYEGTLVAYGPDGKTHDVYARVRS